MNTKKIRISSLPILARCAGMLGAEDGYEETNDAATFGTACHAIAERMARAIQSPENKDLFEITDSCLLELSAACNSDIEQLRTVTSILHGIFENSIGIVNDQDLPCLSSLLSKFQYLRIESEVSYFKSPDSDHTYVGHPDLFAYSVEDEFLTDILVLDWKFGHVKKERYYQTQLMGYLEAIIDTLRVEGRYCIDERVKLTGILLFPNESKSNRFEMFRTSYSALNSWWDDLKHKLDCWESSQIYQPGSHCQYCKARYDCSAYKEIHSQALILLDGSVRLSVDGIEIYNKIKLIKGELAKMEKAIKQHIIDNGEITNEAGDVLGLGKARDKLHSADAIEYLKQEFSDEDILQHVKISKSGVQALAKRDAVRGDKGGAAKRMIEEMKENRIITQAEYGSLKLTESK